MNLMMTLPLYYSIMMSAMIIIHLILIYKKFQHPMFMLLMLILFTLMSCLFISKFLSSFYFSYLMFMVTIGGILIMFMYMTSLTNKNSLNFKLTWIETSIMIATFMFISMLLILPNIQFNYSSIFNYLNNELMNINLIYSHNMTYLTINLMYINTYKITSLCIILLLIMLISVVKLVSKHQGALRQI